MTNSHLRFRLRTFLCLSAFIFSASLCMARTNAQNSPTCSQSFMLELNVAVSDPLKTFETTVQPSPSPAASTASGSEAAAALANPNDHQPSPAPSDATTGTAATAKAAAKGRAIVLPPEKASPVRIPRFDKPPVIDGKLDDDVWKQAVVLKDFYQIEPGDNTPPSKPTEVLMGYDTRYIYFGFRAYDEPGKVRATVAKRDQIFDDDYVGMFLDTFNDQRKAYEMDFNPLGVQADAIFTDNNEDFSFDLVMESKGVLTDNGYTVEVAIPFKSLRYEAGKSKQWGLFAFRRIKRFNNELSSWMPISRDISGTLNQEGHITGLEGISTERTLEIIPSLTLSKTDKRVRTAPTIPFPGADSITTPGRFEHGPFKPDFGVTAKFGLTPTVTLDFAYNPDFAQVEADQTVVTANQRFPIFFEEKRPFFLEGKEIFETRNNVIHTRAIIDPDYAVKLTGKRGRNTFGLILASDNAPGNFSKEEREDAFEAARLDPLHPPHKINLFDKNAYIGVLRLKHDVGRESNVGMFATTYNFIERHNQLVGFDGRFKLDPQTVASFEVIGTTSRNFFRRPEEEDSAYRTGNGFAYSLRYQVNKRHYGWNYDGRGRTRYYRSDVGFVQRTNTNRQGLAGYYSSEPKPKAKLISWNLNGNPSINFDWQGRIQSWGVGPELNLNFAHQTYMGGGYQHGYERIFEEEFGARRTDQKPLQGAFFGDKGERATNYNVFYVYANSTLSKKYSFNTFLGTQRGTFDFDFGAGPRFPRVSPAALADPNAKLDPGPGNTLDINATITYQPTNALRTSLDYTKSRLRRQDTGRIAFDENIYSLRATYQFTRFLFARARADYDTLAANVRAQFLFGWAPNPGTAFYVGYNDDLNRNGFNPFTGRLEPGFRRNGRTFFIKGSYLIRRSFGAK